MAVKNKPCKHCGSELHLSLSCFKAPRKPMRRVPPFPINGDILYNRSMGLQTKEPNKLNCKICSKDFYSYRLIQKYCGEQCSKKAIRKKVAAKSRKATERNKLKFAKEYGELSGKVSLNCVNCHKNYIRYASHIKARGSAFCSNECKWAAKMKSKTKSQLTKDLDTVYSKYIRLLYSDDGLVECITCNKFYDIKNMQNGHYVSRRFFSTRWDIDNCHPQCYSCNVGLAGNYASYSLFMINKYGQGIIEDLVTRSRREYSLTPSDLVERIAVYKQIVSELEYGIHHKPYSETEILEKIEEYKHKGIDITI